MGLLETVAPFAYENEMKKYIKKPIVVEAMQLTRNFAELVIDFIGKDKVGDYNLGEFAEDSCYIQIKTLEGTMMLEEGNYVLRGIEDEVWPVKKSIFESTYEEVK